VSTPYDPTDNAIDAAIQREIDQPIDRYPTSKWTECDKGHTFRQTQNPCKDNRYEPITCPWCDHEARKADLARVLAKNSDLKGKDNGD
jgi:hypothetical protein